MTPHCSARFCLFLRYCYRLNCISPKFKCYSTNPKFDCIWRHRALKGDDIKMRPLGWPLIQFCCSLVVKSCPTLCDTMDCSPPDSCPWGFSRQEYWSGLPCHPPNLGLELRSLPSPALAGEFFTTSATWEAHILHTDVIIPAGQVLIPYCFR